MTDRSPNRPHETIAGIVVIVVIVGTLCVLVSRGVPSWLRWQPPADSSSGAKTTEKPAIDLNQAKERALQLAQQGFDLFKKKDNRAAIASCTSALALDSECTMALCVRAVAQLGEGHRDEAIQDCNEALRMETEAKSTAGLLQLRGAAYIGKGNIAMGVADLKEAVRLDPDNADIKRWNVMLPHLRYWAEVVGAMRHLSQECGRLQASNAPNDKEFQRALTSAVNTIEMLNTSEVDIDTVRAGLEVKDCLHNMADELEHRNDGDALLMELLARSFRGDPLGTLGDLAGSGAKMKQQLTKMLNKLVETRALLSSRYGVEFPPAFTPASE